MNPDFAYQHRCVHCKREAYAPAVLAISKGTHPCCWCGNSSKEMTVAEYQEALRAPKAGVL